MDDRHIEEILNRHADAIIEGRDISSQLLADKPANLAEIGDLFRLALALREALVPKAVPVFQKRLRQALEFQAPSEITLSPPRSVVRKVLMGLAATGSILSIAGLSFILFRRRRGGAQTATSSA